MFRPTSRRDARWCSRRGGGRGRVSFAARNMEEREGVGQCSVVSSQFFAYVCADMLNAGAPDELAEAQPLAPTHDPYAVLRNRDLALYLIGRFIASFGQQMLTLAVGWDLYDRTNSALKLGFVGLTQMVPMVLFTLPAGHVADNYDRKRIIVAMTLLMAVSSAFLALMSGPAFH